MNARRLVGAMLACAAIACGKDATTMHDGGGEVPKGEYVARSHQSPAGTMPYRLFLPRDYDATKRYPLVLWLHGAGGAGTDNAKQIEGDQIAGTQTWTSTEAQAAHPAIVVVPQSSGTWAKSTVPDLSPTLTQVAAILDGLEREFSIDLKRVYALGQSNGGLGVWNLVSNMPERFAAAVLICPVPGDISRAPRAARLPIWIFQGDDDTASFVAGSRALVAALNAAGGRPRYTEYPKAGHDIWTRVFAEPDLATWVFAQQR